MKTYEERMQRWRQLYNLHSDTNYLFVVRYPDERLPDRPPLWPDKKKERIDWIVRKYELMKEDEQSLCDDSLPYLDMSTGTEIFAEALGCKVHRPEGDMPFALPYIHTPDQAKQVKVPKLENSSLYDLFEIADAVRDKVGPDALFKMVDIQSPMDIACLIWDKNDIFIYMLEEPEAVLELAEKTHELLSAFLTQWFERYGTRYIAHFPDYYMEGGLTLSEDEIGAVSTAMFKQFFLPHLNRLSSQFGGIGIHCCADARHQWDGISQINGLRLFNMSYEPQSAEAYAYFKDKTVQMHAGVPVMPGVMPGAHLAQTFMAESRSEAIELAKRIRESVGV